MLPEAERCVKHHVQCSRFHVEQVTGYTDERRRQEEDAIEQSAGYDTEYAEYIEQHPLITFKQWLMGR